MNIKKDKYVIVSNDGRQFYIDYSDKIENSSYLDSEYFFDDIGSASDALRTIANDDDYLNFEILRMSFSKV